MAATYDQTYTYAGRNRRSLSGVSYRKYSALIKGELNKFIVTHCDEKSSRMDIKRARLFLKTILEAVPTSHWQMAKRE